MDTLFPVEPLHPPGFSYYAGFITEEEEEDLLEIISQIQLRTFNFHGYEAKRKVASYGCDWSFTKRQLSKGEEIPVEFHWLIKKVAQQAGIAEKEVAQLLVTEYPVGSVINWHRDAPPFGLIAGISLATDCVFRLRPHDKAKQSRRSLISLPVDRRSLYIMQGEVRTQWQHSTAPVSAVRYSMTFRSLKAGYYHIM